MMFLAYRRLFYVSHAGSAEPKVAVRTCEGKAIRRDHADRNSLVENYAEAHATLALPSGRQAQTKCVRFCESLRSLRETFYQSIEFSPLKQAFVI